MCHITNQDNKDFVLNHGTEVNERQVGFVQPGDSVVAVIKKTNSFLVPTSAKEMNASYKEGEVRFFVIQTNLIEDKVNSLDLLKGQEKDFSNLDLPYGTPSNNDDWFPGNQETSVSSYKLSQSHGEVPTIDYRGDGFPDPCGIN